MTGVRGDVANLADLDRLYNEVKKQNRKTDVLFANAGVAKRTPFGTVTEEFFDFHFNANVVRAVFHRAEWHEEPASIMPFGAPNQLTAFNIGPRWPITNYKSKGGDNK